ncbi:ABC transporter permease [Papillibacter cinnamivorans]|uniref:NitT/TauT family transport system permease protein n=1 Tax=Papillibacter cinnamivorans DSM 12816 TaxID=1122930 RepID=A0A1W2A4U5_9FIRM|nr:ABC transporter permease subunit [Papillibacter cinnamivorans]SMC55298.1 NitT/TauT family transport system permease protein [Papillibacter cinnamivorans DSM 12816]
MESITRSKKTYALEAVLKRLAAAAFWVVLWQLCAYAVGQELLVPTPLAVLRTLLALGREPAFWYAALQSLYRIFRGFVLGAVLGIGLAGLTAFLSPADYLIGPVIRMVRATPVVSFIILILLWVRTDTVPVFIAVLMVIPVVWENTVRGIRETDGNLLEMARVFRIGWFRTARDVYLPSVLPYIAGGCINAMGLAWKAGIAAEVLCLPKAAVGTQVYYSKIYLETPSLFAWTIVVIVLSLLLETLLTRLFGRMSRGRVGRRRGL